MSDQDRMDDMLMATRDPRIGLLFIAPDACKAKHDQSRYREREDLIPGVYLSGSAAGTSPVPYPSHKETLLRQDQARDYACLLDRLAVVTRHGRFDGYPDSWAAFIDLWYDALARRMQRAIDAASDRHSQLRETYAALRGEVAS